MEKQITRCFTLDKESKEATDKLKKAGYNVSALVRKALLEALQKIEK